MSGNLRLTGTSVDTLGAVLFEALTQRIFVDILRSSCDAFRRQLTPTCPKPTRPTLFCPMDANMSRVD
ncbi:hypothetical protein WJX77_006757 [Trebouxia sp. C0004]